jgi:hypothetical protein
MEQVLDYADNNSPPSSQTAAFSILREDEGTR